MELLYIWIEDYKNIYRQGFNFSPLYDFGFTPTIDAEGKVVSGTLIDRKTEAERTELQKVYKGFFHENITNVTAIIGENGSGKSSLIEVLCFAFNTEKHKVVFIRKNDLSNKIEIFAHETFETIDCSSLKKVFKTKLAIEYLDESSCANCHVFSRKDGNNGHQTGSTILFKPFFTGERFYINELWEQEDGTTKGFIDLSIDYLAKKPNYAFDRILKQIFFISQFDYTSIKELKMPQYVTILPFRRNLPNTASMAHLHNKIDDLQKNELSKIQEINKKFIILVLWSFWFENIQTNTYGHKEKLIVQFIDSISPQTTIEKIYEEFVVFANKNKEFDPILTYQDNFRELKLVMEKFSKNYADYFSERSDQIFFNLELKDNIKILNKLKDEFLTKIWNKGNTIDFHWRGLSSGEWLMWDLFATLHYEVKKGLSYELLPNELLLILDEGELGMHPQWQKEYLNRLVTTLPKIFKGKNIQLILTSHSPFLVSDLPKENVIFLEKGKSVLREEQTFGQNIHTLFADSFFMSGGLIGEFAKNKINTEIITVINGFNKENPITTDKAESLSKKIEMIGEPLIKRKLTMMLEEKLAESSKEIQIAYHQFKINQLQKGGK